METKYRLLKTPKLDSRMETKPNNDNLIEIRFVCSVVTKLLVVDCAVKANEDIEVCKHGTQATEFESRGLYYKNAVIYKIRGKLRCFFERLPFCEHGVNAGVANPRVYKQKTGT